MGAWRLAAAALVLGLVIAGAALARPSIQARPLAGYDFGDAPDGRAAGYENKPLVQGSFPSRRASGGPRHTAAGPRLGRAWSTESDARRDDGDDGAGLQPQSCATSTLNVVLDVSRVAPGTPVYVNAWFDWNEDGDWADGREGAGCGPEWGVQNHRVDPAQLKGDVVTLSLRFRAGRLPEAFWWRLQAHTGAPVPHAGGGDQATPTPGETEDELFVVEPPPSDGGPRVLCLPWRASVVHGESASFKGVLVGAGVLRVTRVNATLVEEGFGVVITSQRVTGPQTVRVAVKSTNRHIVPRSPWPVQEARLRIEIVGTQDGRPITRARRCAFDVAHVPKVVARPAAQVFSNAAIAQPGRLEGCLVSDDFVVKGAPRHGFANYGVSLRFPAGSKVTSVALTDETARSEGGPRLRGFRPRADALGPLLGWKEFKGKLRPDGRVLEFFVQVMYRDWQNPAEPEPVRKTWRYLIEYTPSPVTKRCTAVVVGV